MAKKKEFDELHDPTPATHGDLNIWGGQLRTEIEGVKNEVQKSRQETNGRLDKIENKLDQFATKEDLGKIAKKITDHFDKHIESFVENRAANLLGVKHDEVREIQRKVKDHEQRITTLER